MPCSNRLPEILLVLALILPAFAHAHDPSAYGGLFRSRDGGNRWFPADAGLFVSGATALAIDPRDPAVLYYGTDARLLSTRNAGRDWTPEVGQDAPAAPILALTALPSTGMVLAGTGTGVFLRAPDGHWHRCDLPPGTGAVRSLAAGRRLVVATATGLLLADPAACAFEAASGAPGAKAVLAIDYVDGQPSILAAALAGELWISRDDGSTWQSAGSGLPERIAVLAHEPRPGGRLWAASADRLFASEDGGAHWTAVGSSFPDAPLDVHGVAVLDTGRTLVVASARGLLRSTDGGSHWLLLEGTLPIHLEAGPLMVSRTEPGTLYVGFSLTPYAEIARRASGAGSTLAHLDPVSLAGAAAFLVLLFAGGTAAALRLARGRQRRSRPEPS